MNADKLKVSTTTDGKPPRPGYENAGAPSPIDNKTGQHESYWVLSEEERAKGFVRPVRRTYVHLKCGGVTNMSQALSETYARNPKYYGATFCVNCCGHFPLRDYRTDELLVNDGWAFEWDKDGEPVGSNEQEASEYINLKKEREAQKTLGLYI